MLIKPQNTDYPFHPLYVLKMNKLEKDYAYQLEMLMLSGQILRWYYEHLNFRLARKTFYMPDFMVVKKEQIEFHEVKGFWRDDARVKIKVAAQMYPWFKWVAVQWKKKQWIYEEF